MLRPARLNAKQIEKISLSEIAYSLQQPWDRAGWLGDTEKHRYLVNGGNSLGPGPDRAFGRSFLVVGNSLGGDSVQGFRYTLDWNIQATVSPDVDDGLLHIVWCENSNDFRQSFTRSSAATG